MKKLLSLALAALLLISFAIPALAADAAPTTGASQSSTGAAQASTFYSLSSAGYEAAVTYTHTESARGDTKQRDEIKSLLSSLRADKVTTLLISDAHARAGTRIPLSRTDVGTILRLLQTMELLVLSPEEYELAFANPATGGGYSIYIEQGALRCKVDRGSFFTIQYGDSTTSYMFSNSSKDNGIFDLASSMLWLSDTSKAACSLVSAKQLTKRATLAPQFARQTELDAYRRWAAALDARSITKIQYAPFGYEGATQRLTPKQVADLVYVLRDTADTALFSDSPNPTTGGTDSAYLEYAGKSVLLSWDASWLTLQLPDWGAPFIFDISANSGLLARLSDSLSPAPLYQGDSVAALYALDTAGGLTAKLPSFSQQTLTALAKYQQSDVTTAKSTGCGFLIYSKAGKEYIYLKEGAPAELITLCRESLAANPASIQWFTHMNENGLSSALFSPYDTTQKKFVDVTVLDRTRLLAVSDFLKTQLRPIGPGQSTKGESNPGTSGGENATEISFTLKFQSGVEYQCYGAFRDFGTDEPDTFFSIYATDLDRTMSYTVTRESFLKLMELAKKGFATA